MSQRVFLASIGCAFACGALLTAPLSVGAATAKADLVGIGGGNSGGVDVLGIHVLSTDRTKGSSGVAGSASRVNTVSTAPSAQTVVIRSATPGAQAAVPQEVSTEIPVAAAAPANYQPAEVSSARAADVIAAAPAEPPPAAANLPPSPAAPAWPQAALVPSTSTPRPESPLGSSASSGLPSKVPDNFRVGYAEYLRAATNTDLLAAAVPGVAGIAGFTLIGAYAGYRQARALQRALLAPVPTSFLL